MALSIIVRNGTVLDGRGSRPIQADVAISGDTIVEVGAIGEVPGATEIDARGCMVAPGFVNVLSHSYFTLQQDPRGLSDLYQGVTTQIFGEGVSLGPVTGVMTPAMLGLGAIPSGVQSHWTRLRHFLETLEMAGVGFNVASFVGAANLRMAVAGNDERPLTDAELAAACALLDEELESGALGVGSALIYPPGSYADTEELRAFSRVLAKHDAVHISHLRSEGLRFLESVEELIDVARTTGARAEIYHLKAAGGRTGTRWLGRSSWSIQHELTECESPLIFIRTRPATRVYRRRSRLNFAAMTVRNCARILLRPSIELKFDPGCPARTKIGRISLQPRAVVRG